MEYEDVGLGGKAVHIDTPLLDAMARTSMEAASRSLYWPYVAVTPACLSVVMDETDALCDAVEARSDFPVGTMKRPTEDRPAPYFAYDVVMVDDLPEGVDWEWRARNDPPEIHVTRPTENPDV